MRSSIEPQTKEEIMGKISEGERPAVLAQKYGVNVANIYNWIAKEKESNGIETKPKATTLAQHSLDDQIANLTAKYQKELKALLLKQVIQTLHVM